MITRTLFRIAALILLAPAVVSASPPAAVKISYDLSRNGLNIAVVQESFEKKDATYRIVSESNPVGLAALLVRTRIKIESSGTVTASGLRPDQFEYGRLDDASKNVSAAFDWHAEQLRMAFEGRKETAPLPQGTQDRLSLMYQFMFLPPDKLKLITFQMTNGKKIELYRYQSTGNEQIDTRLGKMNTLHLIKQREAGDNNQSEVWLAAERNFVPVKLLIIESDGTRYEQVVTQLDIK